MRVLNVPDNINRQPVAIGSPTMGYRFKNGSHIFTALPRLRERNGQPDLYYYRRQC